MANTVTVKIEGLEKLGQALQELGTEVTIRTSRTATRAAANLVRDAAIAKAPVKTGTLRDSIQVRRDTKLSRPGFELMGVGVFKLSGKKAKERHKENQPAAFYWRYIEFGTVKMSARPFLRPAFDGNKLNAVDKMQEALSAGIEKAASKVR